jgi:hypothetical protein
VRNVWEKKVIRISQCFFGVLCVVAQRNVEDEVEALFRDALDLIW